MGLEKSRGRERERERERVPASSPLVTYNRPQPALNRGFLDQDAELLKVLGGVRELRL